MYDAELLERAADALQSAGLAAKIEDDELVVPAGSEDGFAVRLKLFEERSEWSVSFGELWHEHFAERDEALTCFLEGLCGLAKVRERLRGSTVMSARVYVRAEDGTWRPDWLVGRLSPFWRRKSVRELRNVHLDADEAERISRELAAKRF